MTGEVHRLNFNPVARAICWLPSDPQEDNQLANIIMDFLASRTDGNWTWEIKNDRSIVYCGSLDSGVRVLRVRPGEWVVWFLGMIQIVKAGDVLPEDWRE